MQARHFDQAIEQRIMVQKILAQHGLRRRRNAIARIICLGFPESFSHAHFRFLDVRVTATSRGNLSPSSDLPCRMTQATPGDVQFDGDFP
jgi:hypothetical protein